MNAMVQDMSWDMAARQEGSEITALSSKEAEVVNGGWIFAAIRVATHPITRTVVKSAITGIAAYAGYRFGSRVGSGR